MRGFSGAQGHGRALAAEAEVDNAAKEITPTKSCMVERGVLIHRSCILHQRGGGGSKV